MWFRFLSAPLASRSPWGRACNRENRALRNSAHSWNPYFYTSEFVVFLTANEFSSKRRKKQTGATLSAISQSVGRARINIRWREIFFFFFFFSKGARWIPLVRKRSRRVIFVYMAGVRTHRQRPEHYDRTRASRRGGNRKIDFRLCRRIFYLYVRRCSIKVYRAAAAGVLLPSDSRMHFKISGVTNEYIFRCVRHNIVESSIVQSRQIKRGECRSCFCGERRVT